MPQKRAVASCRRCGSCCGPPRRAPARQWLRPSRWAAAAAAFARDTPAGPPAVRSRPVAARRLCSTAGAAARVGCFVRVPLGPARMVAHDAALALQHPTPLTPGLHDRLQVRRNKRYGNQRGIVGTSHGLQRCCVTATTFCRGECADMSTDRAQRQAESVKQRQIGRHITLTGARLVNGASVQHLHILHIGAPRPWRDPDLARRRRGPELPRLAPEHLMLSNCCNDSLNDSRAARCAREGGASVSFLARTKLGPRRWAADRNAGACWPLRTLCNCSKLQLCCNVSCCAVGVGLRRPTRV